MAKRKRQSSPKVKPVRQKLQQPVPSAKSGALARRVGRMSSAQVLERITHVRSAQQDAEAELAVLIDHAVTLGLGWPEIATRLGVSRQAARQHYHRRHRDDASVGIDRPDSP